MSFLYPNFLFAFFLLGIPIVIHLFYFRRFKKVYFSNVRFVESIKKERQTKNQLKHLLLLILRLLALSALILAFARPYIPQENAIQKQGRNYVSLYIDNSFSMTIESVEGNLLETAKEKSYEIIDAFNDADRFQLLTNDFNLSHQRFYTKDEVKQLISGVQLSPEAKSLKEVIGRQNDIFKDLKGSKSSFIISDFQKSTIDLENVEGQDSLVSYFFIPLQAENPGNIFIDTAWLEKPIYQLNQSNTLKARVTNTSDRSIEEQTITLNINGVQKGLANFSLDPGETKTMEIVFSVTDAGWNNGVVSIKDFPVTFDDDYYVTFYVASSANVLAINNDKPNAYLNAVFKTDAYFNLENVESGNINYGSFRNQELIVLNGLKEFSSGLINELDNFLASGGNVLVIPPLSDINQKSYNDLFARFSANKIENLKTEKENVKHIFSQDPLMEDIFEEIPQNVRLPVVTKYYKLSQFTSTRERKLLTLGNGDVFLSYYPYGSGNLFVSSVPFDEEWSDFPRHAIFVPLIYKMALFLNRNHQIAYTMGDDQVIEVKKGVDEKDPIVKFSKGDNEFIPEQKIKGGKIDVFINDDVKEAGIYKLYFGEEHVTSNENVRYIAFNYNRNESKLEYFDIEQLKDVSNLNPRIINGLNVDVERQLKNIEKAALWKWFLLGALVFLLGEIIIARTWKE